MDTKPESEEQDWLEEAVEEARSQDPAPVRRRPDYQSVDTVCDACQ